MYRNLLGILVVQCAWRAYRLADPLARNKGARTHPHTLTRMNGTVKGTAQRVRQGEKLINRYHRGVCKGPENGTRTGNRDSDAIHHHTESRHRIVIGSRYYPPSLAALPDTKSLTRNDACSLNPASLLGLWRGPVSAKQPARPT